MPRNHSALSYFLARLTRRSRLDQEECDAILGLRGDVRQYAAKHDLIRPRDETVHATLVSHGLVGRFDQMSDGGRQLTALYVRGDMCDLHSVVSPVAGWGLMALSTATVLEVPHEDLRGIAEAYPAVARALWRDTTVDASVLSKWVGNLGRKSARRRIAHLFCEMGTRMEQADLGAHDCFVLDMSQDQLAEASGLTAVHVNRTLQELRRDNLVSTKGRAISIPDWKQLCDVADFDPVYLLQPNHSDTARTLTV